MIDGKLVIFSISSMTAIYHLSNEIGCELTKVCITIRVLKKLYQLRYRIV